MAKITLTYEDFRFKKEVSIEQENTIIMDEVEDWFIEVALPGVGYSRIDLLDYAIKTFSPDDWEYMFSHCTDVGKESIKGIINNKENK